MAGEAHVHRAEIELADGLDPAAVGAAVTTELCGHWEHEGPCRWPHHNAISVTGDTHVLRVVFVAADDDVDEVETRIDAALHTMDGATVIEGRPDVLHDDELALAARLTRTPAADD